MYDEELARNMEFNGIVKRLCGLSGPEFIFGRSQRFVRPSAIEPGRAPEPMSIALKSSHAGSIIEARARREQNVTLFGKTRLNENCVEMHFKEF